MAVYVNLLWKDSTASNAFSISFKDDIGDKSVFTFNSLSEDEKKALVEKLEQQKYSEKLNQ